LWSLVKIPLSAVLSCPRKQSSAFWQTTFV
jgi:hypothetical protein